MTSAETTVCPKKSVSYAGDYRQLRTRSRNATSHQGALVALRQRMFWRKIMDTAEMKHTPHECRHTFRSRLDSAGANKRCIDLMMGHKSKDVGERVYTHKTFGELKTAIELLE